jgi:hypothetical protein
MQVPSGLIWLGRPDAGRGDWRSGSGLAADRTASGLGPRGRAPPRRRHPGIAPPPGHSLARTYKVEKF